MLTSSLNVELANEHQMKEEIEGQHNKLSAGQSYPRNIM